VEYAGTGGDAQLLGLYFADAGQHLEHRLFVDHNAPRTRSNVDYRGALQGKGAHTVWIGDVLIRKVAEGITTYESNRNLVLTDGCRADSVPNLEIETGEIEIGIGAGVESMTMGYGPSAIATQSSEKIPRGSQDAADCQLSMGITSENVARDFGIDRKSQDEFAALSFQRAALAQKEGRFKDEIVPVRTFTKASVDKANINNNGSNKEKNDEEQKRPVTISQDDGIRDGVTFETLSKIRPAFASDGSTTAGNASQISDGAAAVLLMRRRTAKRLGMPILGKYITSVVRGVSPRVMGIGPAVAIPAVCKKAAIEIKDVDLFELNEAFASQTVYTIKTCGLDTNKVNVNGGALAIGHPLGCTGARQIATLMNELKRRKERVGVVTMCMATGMGAAAIFENEQV